MTHSLMTGADTRSPVTPLMRAIVLTVTLTIFTAVVAYSEAGSTPSNVGFVDVGVNAVSSALTGLISSFGLLVRAAVGLLILAPIDHAPDVILGRPNALSLQSLAMDTVVSTLLAIALPWLDPPRSFWHWMATGSRQRVRFGLIALAWAIWLLAAVVVFAMCGYVVGSMISELAGVSQEPWSGAERFGLGVLLAAVTGLAAMIGFVLRGRHQARRVRLIRSLVISAVYAGIIVALFTAVVASTARGIIVPDQPAAELLADAVKEFRAAPVWFIPNQLGMWALLSVILLPVVFVLLTLDERASSSGKRSITATLGLVLGLVLLGVGWGSVIAVVTGSLVFGSGGHGQGDLLGKVCGVGAALALTAWIVRRRRPSAAPEGDWPQKQSVYVPLPDAVADAVDDAAKRPT